MVVELKGDGTSNKAQLEFAAIKNEVQEDTCTLITPEGILSRLALFKGVSKNFLVQLYKLQS
jgi:hypothetical protein